jgi:thioredoxin
MSKTVHIESTDQFSALLSSSTVVVADFYADWCGPCKQIAPIFEQLSAQLSRPNKITFAKIDTDKQQDLSRSYGVRAMPTFMVFRNARRVEFIEGADPRKLSNVVKDLANEVNKMDTGEAVGTSNGGTWLGAELPRGYVDVTSQVDVLGLEMLNWDSDHGNARTLISSDKPKGKQRSQQGALRHANARDSQVKRNQSQIGSKATQTNSSCSTYPSSALSRSTLCT